MSEQTLLIAVAALLACAAVASIGDLRGGVPAERRALAVTLCALGLATVCLTRPVYRQAEQISGIPNVAEPLARSGLLVAAVGAQSVLLYLADASRPADGPLAATRIRRRWAIFAVTLVALWTTFLLSPNDESSRAFLVHYGSDGWVGAYLVIYLGYLGWGSIDLLRAARRLRPRARLPLRRGLTLIALGAGVGCLYVSARILGEVALLAGHPGAAAVWSQTAVPLGGTAGLLSAGGALWPAAHDRQLRMVSWLADYLANARLYRLWRDLVTLFPSVALEAVAPRAVDTLRVRDVPGRLYRRIIELRDGRRDLRQMLEEGTDWTVAPGDAEERPVPSGGGTPAEGTAPEDAAAREGVALALAVRTARGELPGGVRVDLDQGQPAAAIVSDEVRWWTQVAVHYSRAMTTTPRRRPPETSP